MVEHLTPQSPCNKLHMRLTADDGNTHRTGIAGGQHAVKPTNWEIFWAGCAGGAAQLVVACPVDLAKIKLQVQTQTGEIHR